MAGVLAGGGSYIVNDGGSEITANLFAVSSGGSPNCARSSSLISFDAADDVNAICGPGVRTSNSSINGTPFGNACHAATAGDVIGVRNNGGGATYDPNASNGFMLEGPLDCSDGSGVDYDPNWEEKGNSEASLANWVTFKPAQTPTDITFAVGSFTIPQGNYHMIWENIPINTGVKFNYGGESAGQQAKNIIFRGSSSSNRMRLYGLQIIGSKNILLKHINNGPSNQCAKNDANVPVAWRCNPSGPWFESQYANKGTASPGCDPEVDATQCGGWWAFGGSEWAETYIHDGGAGSYENIRLEDYINHDQQSIQDSTCCAHPGCLMQFGGNNGISTPHNGVLDHYVCERAAAATIQFFDSGWTIQNSVFSCQVQSLENTGGDWDGTCANSAFGMCGRIDMGHTGFSNVLFRFNYFGASGGFNAFSIQNTGNCVNSFTNVRVVGNVLAGAMPCLGSITYDSNAFTNGVSTCGTNAQSLSAGDPVVNSSYGTPDDLYDLDGDVVDAHADGSPAYSSVSLSGDLNLNHDMDRDARSGTTKPGPDN